MRDYRQEWSNLLRENFSLFETLSNDHKALLLNKISIFYKEKQWPNEIDETEKVLCCARACMPILNRKSNFYPGVTSGFLRFTLEDWVQQNEIQFEKEVGKMALREFEGRFIQESIDYFNSPKKYKKSKPRFYKLLNFYYKLLS